MRRLSFLMAVCLFATSEQSISAQTKKILVMGGGATASAFRVSEIPSGTSIGRVVLNWCFFAATDEVNARAMRQK